MLAEQQHQIMNLPGMSKPQLPPNTQPIYEQINDQALEMNVLDQMDDAQEQTSKAQEQSEKGQQQILQPLRELSQDSISYQEFVSFIAKSDEVSKTTNNHKVICIIGTTGAGKSSLIQSLCGSEIQKTQNNGLKHNEFGNLTNQDQLNVKVIPNSRSETRYIRPIKIGKSPSESITLVDSPGLFDLKNAEVDFSNQIGIIKALQVLENPKEYLIFYNQKSLREQIDKNADLRISAKFL